MIERYYVNGGGTTKYDHIALKLGWFTGFNSKYYRTLRAALKVSIIDNDFLNYNHDHHLKFVKHYQPRLATSPDILEEGKLSDYFSYSEELLPYCTKLILIPKINCLKDILAFSKDFEEKILLGYPVGRFENTESRNWIFTDNFQVHLLGGSFKRLSTLINTYSSLIFSFDTNYPSRLASFGKIDTITGDRKPFPNEIKKGKDFNYRCFKQSLTLFDDFLLSNQLQIY